MKKILTLILSIIITFTLVGCEESTRQEETDFVFDVPSGDAVNLQNLPYTDYLSLNNPVVTITVEGMGDIEIQLFPNVAPNTVNNFIQYIQSGKYNDTVIHRIVTNFVIQGGLLEEPDCNISGEMINNGFQNELGHTRGVLSMARVPGDYDSQNSQFFIMTTNNQMIDGDYASFGGVTRGFNIIDYIASLKDPIESRPITTITITSITIDLKNYVPSDRICITE